MTGPPETPRDRHPSRPGDVASVETVATGLGFTEGPVLLPDGRVAVASISQGAVHLVAPDGGVETVRTGGGPNGLALGADGALFVAQNGGIWGASERAEPGVQVVRDGRVEYLVTGSESGMAAPNDLVVGPDGRLWVTDPRAEVSADDPRGLPAGRLWAVDPASGAWELVLDNGPRFVNGLGFDGAGAVLHLTATLAGVLLVLPVAAGRRGLRLGAASVRHRFEDGHPDGLAVDGGGRTWVALTSADRIDVVAPDGTLAARHELPPGSLPTNVCLAADLSVAYLTAARAGALLRLRL